jgi:hypothetical protein
MLGKLEKKMLQCKSVRINGITYEFKRCTPEDFLGKDGIPISKWQAEAEFIANKERVATTTLAETQIIWKKLFKKAIISIQGKTDNLDILIELLTDNYFVSSELYTEIVKHCLQFKKKPIFLNLFRKQQ